LQWKSLAATQVSTKVTLDRGKLEISELSANLLGGKHRGEWQADFNLEPAVCQGAGSLTGVSLARLADTMKNSWISGTANSTYDVKGTCPTQFWTSAEGTLQFDMQNGTLPHVFLPEDAGPLRVTRFVGLARLRAGAIELTDSKLNSPDGKFQLTGTASLKGELDFKLARTSSSAIPAGYTITGTLAAPHVVSMPGTETQARLKTDPAK
jgi:uncharacterized protein involved in outer membrane biogenesis